MNGSFNGTCSLPFRVRTFLKFSVLRLWLVICVTKLLNGLSYLSNSILQAKPLTNPESKKNLCALAHHLKPWMTLLRKRLKLTTDSMNLIANSAAELGHCLGMPFRPYGAMLGETMHYDKDSAEDATKLTLRNACILELTMGTMALRPWTSLTSIENLLNGGTTKERVVKGRISL
ncbi:hypothetical protein SVAN01_12003 [Stagonosporopsis vannaccii]|nr:hypothetical protein SVAN01_12003 [Stagonosporopsis vannaccii]